MHQFTTDFAVIEDQNLVQERKINKLYNMFLEIK